MLKHPTSPNQIAWIGGNMATATVTPAVSPAQLTVITAEEISRYASLAAQIKSLEAQKDRLRDEVLALHDAGAEQETTSPYLLQFVDQVRRTVDWKNHALQLATKLYGIEKAEQWKLKMEVSAPPQTITQIKPVPNPEYAANVAPPPAKRPVVSIGMPNDSLAKSGD
jgi:hypothetical protein